MRTSNKILLGGFVATILIITGIHAVLYAKIKSGDLVSYDDERLRETRHVVAGNIKHVNITGLEGFLIAPGDTAIMQLDSNLLKRLGYRVSGDTLTIDAGFTNLDYQHGVKGYLPLGLELPENVTITTNYCRWILRGATDSTTAISRNIHLINSELNVTYSDRETKTDYWKSLQVNTLHSHAMFGEGTIVHELTVILGAESNLTDGGADLQHFSLQVDSTSTVSLRKKSLNNIKLVK